MRIERQTGAIALAAVDDLLQAVALQQDHQPLPDHLWLDLRDGGGPGFVAVTAHDDGALIGYAQGSRGNGSTAAAVVLAPNAESPELAEALLGELLAGVADNGGGTVDWWVAEPSQLHETAAAEAGLHRGRDLLQMARALPVGTPIAIETRSFRPGIDDDDLVDVNNRAFADHHEQGGWTVATLRRRMAEPWFDPDGLRIHDRDGRLAGFCWTKLHAERWPVEGEIYVIAVDPDFHGRGLGRQLTLAGLDSIALRDVVVGMLYVDAANTAAVHLYRSLGFAVRRRDRAYTVELAPTAS